MIRDFLPEERPARLSRGDPARLQSATAGATTSTRRASRSWSTRSASRRFARQVEAELRARSGRRAEAAAKPSSRASRAYFAPPALRAAPPATTRSSGARRDPGFARWRRRTTSRRTSVPGYAIVDDLAEADRRHAGRRHAPTRWTRSPTSPSAIRFDEVRVTPRAEPGPAACRAGRSAGGLRRAGRRSAWPTANAGLITDIIACPGLDYCALANARSIPIAQDIAERFADAERAARDRRAEDQDLRLHQCLRPPPCRPYRHSRRREEGRGVYQITLGGIRRPRTPRSARSSGRGFDGRGGARRDRARSSTSISPSAGDGERFLDTFRRVGMAPFKTAFKELADAVA